MLNGDGNEKVEVLTITISIPSALRGSVQVVEDSQSVPKPTPSGRANRFRFSMANLSPGDHIAFVKDSSIMAEIVSDAGPKSIRYKGKLMSMSAAASDILGYHTNRGPEYWTYGGITMKELRKRKEASELKSNAP